jgi:hypothetical protein
MNIARNSGKLLFVLLFFILLCRGANAQTKPEMGTMFIKTADGYLFVNNSDDRSFTFEIKGKEVQPMKNDNNPTFTIDDRILQVVLVDTKNFITDQKKRSPEEILDLHKTWESDYLGEAYGKAPKIESEAVSLKDLKALFWGFKREKYNQEYVSDYFLTTLVGDSVLAISSPLKASQTASDSKKYFISTLETLKISDKPFDVNKLADDIRKGGSKEN